MRRAKRLKRLHNAGAKPARIMSGGALASAKYGVSGVGPSDARLALVRNRAACALRNKTNGFADNVVDVGEWEEVRPDF